MTFVKRLTNTLSSCIFNTLRLRKDNRINVWRLVFRVTFRKKKEQTSFKTNRRNKKIDYFSARIQKAAI